MINFLCWILDKEPPVYDFTKIKSKLYLFIGSNDWLSTQKDVLEYLSKIENQTTPKVKAYWSDDDHLDFIWGKESHVTLYPKVVKILDLAKN